MTFTVPLTTFMVFLYVRDSMHCNETVNVMSRNASVMFGTVNFMRGTVVVMQGASVVSRTGTILLTIFTVLHMTTKVSPI